MAIYIYIVHGNIQLRFEFESLQVLETSLFHFYMYPGRRQAAGRPTCALNESRSELSSRPWRQLASEAPRIDWARPGCTRMPQMKDACSVCVCPLQEMEEQKKTGAEFRRAWFISR